MRICFAAAASAVVLALSAPALAREPAVSVTNLKVTVQGGSVDDEGGWLGVAGLTAPLGSEWGVQAEGGLFGVDDDSAYGLAGHVFKRDPASYLAGVFVAYAHEDNFDFEVTRVGGEVEFYLDRVTLMFKGGYQFADLIDDTVFGEAQIAFYASDNFVLGAGVSFDENAALGHAGAEWLVGAKALPGLALRADAYFGENDFDSIMGGITYYFGTDASLKDRHRKQDPDSALFDLFQAIEAERAGACVPPPIENNISLNSTACPPPPPPIDT